MALSAVPYTDLFTHHSNSDKYVFDSSGDLTLVTAPNLPLDHDPVTLNPRGVLIEPESTNVYPDSLGMGTDLVLTPGVTNIPASGANNMQFFTDVLSFDENTIDKNLYYEFDSPVSWDYIGISFFIRFEDGSEPIYGRTYNRNAYFHILINDLDIIDASSDLKIIGPLNDGSYWFRGRIKSPQQPIIGFKIGTERRQIQKNFILGGLQIEENLATSFILTNGSPVTREENWLSGSLTPGVNVNRQQGTIDIQYEHVEGSDGTAFTLYDSLADSDAYFIMGDKRDQTIDHIVINADAYDNPIGIEHPDLRETESPTRIRFTYSDYGNRISINQGPIIRTKNFNYLSDDTKFPLDFLVGKSTDDRVMHGYFKGMNVHGRAYTDEEMVQ